MIEFALLIELCARLPCEWHEVARYRTEQTCVMVGLATDPQVAAQFKCVSQNHVIPLPRPRPSTISNK